MTLRPDRSPVCGAPATHVDHIVPLSYWSGPPRKGSTTRWRKVRAYVLARDGHRCALPVDDQGHYDAASDVTAASALEAWLPASNPDRPANLRAACAQHNLQRGAGPAEAKPHRWEW